MPEERCAVAIMAKASVAGTVKTRLVPPLTHEEAAELNTCCLPTLRRTSWRPRRRCRSKVSQHTIRSVRSNFSKTFSPMVSRCCRPRSRRSGAACFTPRRTFSPPGYGSICLVNADSPTLPTELLVETVRQLREPGDRVVLGPAADGGYYLIGLKRFHRRLFQDIDWSTERVFRQTIARAGEIGLAVASLPEWYDVDDEESLAVLGRELLSGGAGARSAIAAIRRRIRPLFSTGWRRQIATSGGSSTSRAAVPFPPPPAAKG